MNKKILALAIGALLAAPAAFAGEAEIYGQMRLGFDVTDNGSGGYTRPKVTDYVSRIGVKGSEDLGDGLKAVWQLEEQLVSESGGGGLFPSAGGGSGFSNLRDTYAGLAGGWGVALMGTHDTPYKMASAPLDIFVDTVGDYNAIEGAASGNLANTVFDLRPGNVLAYVTPTFSGVTGAIAYVAGAETGTVSGLKKGYAWSGMVNYADGPIYAEAAYELHQVGSAGGTLGLGINAKRSAWKIGGGYTLGDAKIGAGFESQKWDTALGNMDHDDWFINGQYNMGAIALKAQFAYAGKSDAAKAVGANDKGELWAIGAAYNFSKRTDLDLTYAHISNSGAAMYNFGSGSNLTGLSKAGADPSTVSLQLNHKF